MDCKQLAMKIIFFHGLESGPGARKHKWLQENYASVACVDMQMSVADPMKSHSFARNVMTNLFFTAPWNLPSRCIESSLEQCLSCQKDEMASVEHQNGVLVGSSWGGAVATLAIARGLWSGPAVLIAPAYFAVMGRFGAYSPENEPLAVYAAISERLKSPDYCGQVIVVHGTADERIPIDHSRTMAMATGMRLLEVEGADHSMRKTELPSFVEQDFETVLEAEHQRIDEDLDRETQSYLVKIEAQEKDLKERIELRAKVAETKDPAKAQQLRNMAESVTLAADAARRTKHTAKAARSSIARQKVAARKRALEKALGPEPAEAASREILRMQLPSQEALSTMSPQEVLAEVSATAATCFRSLQVVALRPPDETGRQTPRANRCIVACFLSLQYSEVRS
ncbi:unnamed protein product [Symbiodinium natans]|uniref:Uncharacterized protein n=1 Tax=Symbiodinium natans TaxID=878477 RepID=A0A812TZZ1_9DINO|nr:unnamed protein product [Symbiodinium natans]